MKQLGVLLIFLSAISAVAQPDLDFQTTQGGWTTGALSKSYSSIGTPAADVAVLIGGTTSGLQSNSPQAFSRGLQLAVNQATNTACVTVTITVSPSVQGVTFRILNVDRGAANGANYDFIDQVTVSGKNGGSSVTPAISASGSAGTYSTISGNTITGTGDAPGSASDPGNLVVFASIVTEITIMYCNNAALTIANPGAQTITIEDLSWNAPLPVRLVSFEGKAVGNQVALNWETTSEQNSDYFDVERSGDAREFSRLAHIPAVGQSDSRVLYAALDPEPVAGINYYRLKQVDGDNDQSVTYSKIIAVVLDETAPALAVLGNPLEGGHIRLAFRQIDPQTLSLQTVSGVSIRCRISNESATGAELIPIQALAPGVYWLSGYQGARRLTVKLLVR